MRLTNSFQLAVGCDLALETAQPIAHGGIILSAERGADLPQLHPAAAPALGREDARPEEPEAARGHANNKQHELGHKSDIIACNKRHMFR